MKRLKEIEVEMLAAPDKQVSLTDPDSRSMKTRGQGIVGYNVQTAVDAEHHLIVAHEVTNEGTDRRQLTNMSIHSREALNQDNLTIIADRGYFRSEEILASYHAGFRPLIPKTYTSNNVAQGRFARTDFIFIASGNNIFAQLVNVYDKPDPLLKTIKFTKAIPALNVRTVTLKHSVLREKSVE